MALHVTPEEHDAHPPSTWEVVKSGRRWELRQAGADWPLDSFTTRKAAEAAKVAGHLVTLYEKEGRWFAGEPVAGWKPYRPTDHEWDHVLRPEDRDRLDAGSAR